MNTKLQELFYLKVITFLDNEYKTGSWNRIAGVFKEKNTPICSLRKNPKTKV